MKESTLQLLHGWLYVLSGLFMLFAGLTFMDNNDLIIGTLAAGAGGIVSLLGVGELLERQHKKSIKTNRGK